MSQKQYFLEICATSLQSAKNAEAGGADRIELCTNLAEGGTTPSYGLIKACKKSLEIPVFVLIRPRGGDFVYHDEELAIMKHDIQVCKDLGVDGVVVGVLNKNKEVDRIACKQLIDLAKPMQVTFHRAFDDCNDQEEALKSIIDLGCERLLTSGGKPTAIEGKAQLKKLVSLAKNKIEIMAGAGVKSANINELIEVTKAIAYHTTARKQPLKARFDNSTTLFPNPDETDLEEVKLLRSLLSSS